MKRVAIKIGILVICVLSAFALNASHFVLTCEAAFTYQPYQGSNPSSTGITFTNLSTGTNLTYAWDFGDGNFSSEGTDTLDYFYMSEGLYDVCLTVWDDQGCSDTFCGEVIVGNLVDVCNIADCVWSGDANKDGEANFYDLLEIGVGHGTTGPIRPNATNDWVGQIAPDWTQSTVDGINFKHLDCNGDGIIDDNDLNPVNGNYSPMTAANPTAEFGAPLIHIEFDQDTIYVDDNSANIEVVARLKVGTSDYPANDIYGLALYLGYPEDLVFEDSVFFHYENNSFFGPEQEVLWMPSHQYDESQLDLGVARTDGTPVGGFGEIGQGVFIINGDIIIARVGNGDVNFPVHVNGVRMIDSLGNELPVNLSPEPATLVFSKLEEETSSVDDSGIANAISIFPNPTSESVLLNTSFLDATEVEMFDSFGRSIFRQPVRDKNTSLNMKGLNNGIYFIKVHTDEGIITKRVMKQ